MLDIDRETFDVKSFREKAVADGSRINAGYMVLEPDVFDYIDFDLRNPAGRSVITRVNGLDAAYMQELKEGDNLEIFWEKR